MQTKNAICFAVSSLLWASISLTSQAQAIWTLGLNDDGWPCAAATPCVGGGANANFVQENGGLNGLPGNPANPVADTQADNDYYFAGVYTAPISSVTAMYGDYTPVGVVAANEESAERAFYIPDNEMRVHFNLADTLQPNDLLSVTFDVFNLDTGDATRVVPDPRWGLEVYFNGVKVQDQIMIRGPQLGTAYTTPQFSLASVNGQTGAGADNIVTLKGINFSADGGGDWMGFDYVQLNPPSAPIPQPVFPWTVGLKDDGWPCTAATPCDGGGANATFVQEMGINPLPGNPASPEVDQQADDDYYFAGVYSNIITGNGDYTPVGLVAANEEAVERAFSGEDNDLRYHFNLPNTATPGTLVSVNFAAANLDDTAGLADPRYGIEVYFNGVKVMPEVVIRPAQLGQIVSTPPFTLGSVNAESGTGFDNIVTLRGINHGADGGGQWMGIDYVELAPFTTPIPAPALPWSVGLDDDAWPPGGDGGGTNANFVQADGQVNPLPGNPHDDDEFLADNDYYFAGSYVTTVAGNGIYVPAGIVVTNEETAQGELTTADNELRYHFNLPSALTPDSELSVTFDALNLDVAGQSDPRFGIEVYCNNVLIQTQIVIRPADLGTDFTTPRFTLASVNAQTGPGVDNIVTLKGISYAGDGGGNSISIDYIELSPESKVKFPWAVGRNDNGWPVGDGGGPNATFVQESGTNPLPGNPANPEVDQQGDDDYYFAGIYTNTIASAVATYGPYTPVGVVLANEEAAERAFAGTDNDLRYHFNLPETISENTEVTITYDPFNLDDPANPVNTDLRYGVEVYFNGVKVQDEVVIRPAQLGMPVRTAPFTLWSVNAQLGLGYDNIVHLKGINHNAEGGGNWMGIDYVRLDVPQQGPFPWMVGSDDDMHITAGEGGGPNTSFVQENGVINPLPGNTASPAVDGQADNDYYFAGDYTTAIPGVTGVYGDYTPVGLVPINEEAAERAFANADNDLRYHFNLPESLQPDDLLTVTFDPLDLDNSAGLADPRYGVEVYFNGVLIQPQKVIRPADLGVANITPAFTLASVDARVGSGFDNIVSLKGFNYSAEGGGNWMGIDYVKLGTVPLMFLPPSVSDGQVRLNWTGTGILEWAPTVLGPWTAIDPAPAPPYSEAIVSGANRFFRLRMP